MVQSHQSHTGKKHGTLMVDKEIDRLVEDVMTAYGELDSRLHGKGRFPISHFRAFFGAAVRYIEATKEATMIHRSIASVVSGLREKLSLHAHVPGMAIADADRLECMLLSGYDPYFEGDEPPGL